MTVKKKNQASSYAEIVALIIKLKIKHDDI